MAIPPKSAPLRPEGDALSPPQMPRWERVPKSRKTALLQVLRELAARQLQAQQAQGVDDEPQR
jgi:hypothetical protein